MPHAGLSDAVGRVRRADASDGQLLTAFLDGRGEAAFADLVARFGPMVFAVCRRLTGHHQDAEDAFQAVFVVLARRAEAVEPREAVGAWLYGVAVRTAREARTVSARRRGREARLPDVARPEPARPDTDLAGVLDEELAALPEKYRTLLVLCDLRGEAQVEVADRLGLPAGTVYSRLSAARERLAARLRARGVVGCAVGVATAAVPDGLAARAVAAALAPETAPAAVAALSSGVLRAMTVRKFLLPVAVTSAVALATIGGLLAARPDDPPTPAPLRLVQKAAAKPERLLLTRPGRLVLLSPDGKTETAVTDPAAAAPSDGRLSPDGKRVAYLLPGKPGKPDGRLVVHTIGEKEPADLGVNGHAFCWSADGELGVSSHFDDKEGSEHFTVSVTTREKAKLPLPADHRVCDASPDGKRFLTMSLLVGREGLVTRLYLMNRDGTTIKSVGEEKAALAFGRLSPDGSRVLCGTLRAAPAPDDRAPRLLVVDAATGVAVEVADIPEKGRVVSHCWSPDGKRIAFALHQAEANEGVLVVCDADGRNAKAVTTEKVRGTSLVILGAVDWR